MEDQIPSRYFAQEDHSTLPGAKVQLLQGSSPSIVDAVNRASIIRSDILAFNCLFHEIDTVLLPDPTVVGDLQDCCDFSTGL